MAEELKSDPVVEAPQSAASGPAQTPTPEQTPAVVAEKHDEYDLSGMIKAALEQDAAPRTAPERDPVTGRFVASAPTEPLPEPAPPEPVKHKHSAATRRLARDFGIPDEEVDSTSPEILDDRVYHLNRQAFQWLQWNAAQSQQQQHQGLPPAKSEPEPVDDIDLGEAAKNWEPELVDLIKTAVRKPLEEAKRLKEELEQLKRKDYERESASAYDQMDAFFAEHPHIYGEGRGIDLHTKNPNDPALFRRKAVSALIQSGKGDVKTLLAQAHAMMYGAAKPPEKAQPQKKNGVTPDAWNRGGLARPTYRETQEPRGPERAEKKIGDLMQQYGFPSTSGDEFSYEEEKSFLKQFRE